MLPQTDLYFSLLSSHDSDLPSSLSDIQSIDGASDVLSEIGFESRTPNFLRIPTATERHARISPRRRTWARRPDGAATDLEQATKAPRTLWVVTIVLACAQEAASSPLG